MTVRAATAQDATGIVALHRSANPYGDWYRNPLQRLGRVPYEDLTPLERYLHGGFGMDLSLFRRHLHELQRRGFPVLVAEDRGKIVGECEVWTDEEPAPFGRYAAIVRFATGLPPNSAVEEELRHHAEERVRKLGYPGIDLSAAAAPRGAKPLTKYGALWENHSFAADLRAVPPPDEEFETTFLGGEYGALEGLIPLDHREPARWRFETLTALWPAAELAGLQDATKLVAVIVRPSGGARFAVLAALREWIDPPVAELDVWLDPAKITKAPEIVRAYRIAAEVARKLGTKRAETFAPPHAAKPIKSLGFSATGRSEPWLRKSV